MIGENGQGIGTSSFADWVKNVSNLDLPTDEKLAADELIDAYYAQLEEGLPNTRHSIPHFSKKKTENHNFCGFSVTGLQFLNNEGSALYSIESKANHSCVPNAQAKFPKSNDVVHLIATRDIQCGTIYT